MKKRNSSKALYLGAASALVLVVADGSAIAQTTSGSPQSLPNVTVEAPAPERQRVTPAANRRAANTTRSRRSRNVNQQAVAPNPSAGPGQGASGPTVGFVATQTGTATKTNTPVIEIPQSVSTITREQMDIQNVQSLREAIRYTPGVVAEPRGVVSRLQYFYIRGFGPSGNQFLDGLRLLTGEFGFPVVDPYFLQQVDVLRGPSAMIYGQSPPGGLVNMVSKRPTEETFRQVDVQYGTFNTGQIGFDFGGPVDAEKKLLYRFTGLGYNSDGQVDFANQQRVAFQPAVTWRPDEQTSLTIIANYQNDPRAGYNNILPAFGTALPNPNGVIPRNFNPTDPSYNTFSVEQSSLGYQFEHRFNEALVVRQNLRYMHVDSDIAYLSGSGLRTDLRTLNRYAYADREHLDALTTDTNLQADVRTGPVAHRVLVGFDSQNSDLNQRYAFNFGAPPINAFAPVYGGVSISNPFTGFITSSSKQYGFYAQDQLKLDRFILTLGARNDWYETYQQDTGTQQNIPWDSYSTYRAGLTYLFDNGVAPYVSYSESFQPTGAISGRTADRSPLKPTTGQQYEVGIKYQPPGTTMLFTAAAFDIKQQNVTSRDPINTAFVVQTGEVASRGFELEAKASVFKEFNVTGAYTYLDMENTRSNNTAPGIFGGTFSTQGLWPVAIPRHTASVWGDYLFNTGPAAGLRLGAGVRYVGSTYGDAANSFIVSPFTLVDMMASYDLGAASPQWKGLLVSVNANNLFDKTYVASCSAGAACFYGYGRTVMSKLTYRW
jgi:iron complex outermembrane recepter protein